MSRFTTILIVFLLVWGLMPRGPGKVTRNGVTCWDHGNYSLCVAKTTTPGYRGPLVVE